MLRPYTNITINNKSLLGLARSVVVESRRNEFTDKAEIIITNNIPKLGGKISEVFKIGDVVTIEAGYYPNSHTIFNGYISEIIPDRTATIICEDEAYIYKRQTIDKAVLLRNTTTSELFNTIFSGQKTVFDAKIGDFKITKDASILDVMNKLREKFSIYSYFRNSVLIVGGGLTENLGNEKTIIADFQKNVPEGESSIDFKEATAAKAIVKAKSEKRNGDVLILYGTYGQGNEILITPTKPVGRITDNIQLGQNDLTSRTDLETMIIRRLESRFFTGVNGSVTIYGEPQVLHGDNVQLIDVTRPEINETYKCVGVMTSFSVDGGFRQELALGAKVQL